MTNGYDCLIPLGIIAVPAQHAQGIADLFVAAGVNGILNFAPTAIQVPPQTYLEDMDITMSLDKVVYFASESRGAENNRTTRRFSSG